MSSWVKDSSESLKKHFQEYFNASPEGLDDSSWQRTANWVDASGVVGGSSLVADLAFVVKRPRWTSSSAYNFSAFNGVEISDGYKASYVTDMSGIGVQNNNVLYSGSLYEDDLVSSNGTKHTIDIYTSYWNHENVILNRLLDKNYDNSLAMQAKYLTPSAWEGAESSVLVGGSSNDVLRGLGGWDIIDAGAGDDLVHGGNGRDIILGGEGSDELHGDFGTNIFTGLSDGEKDLIAIKSDQHLSNWWYGTSGNNPSGEKIDFIRELDEIDEIKIIGVSTKDISFKETSIDLNSGIGIYADGYIEALYVGNNLTSMQLEAMTTGDASDAAMSNQIWSYWSSQQIPDLVS